MIQESSVFSTTMAEDRASSSNYKNNPDEEREITDAACVLLSFQHKNLDPDSAFRLEREKRTFFTATEKYKRYYGHSFRSRKVDDRQIPPQETQNPGVQNHQQRLQKQQQQQQPKEIEQLLPGFPAAKEILEEVTSEQRDNTTENKRQRKKKELFTL